ncbi:adenosine receptor A2b-like [Stylophora pistillata]|uniref:adenosine receptor A2b-like n=1 Tax=Stylophora pistillata TaxID=50429 RepID=UPI000C047018|nr:adenosine receptor A2b-like [Stylophora pistillata]
MNNLSCKLLQNYLGSAHDVKDLRSTFIANSVFNNCSTYTSIMLNVVIIFALRKASSIPKTLKTLLISLAVSDVGVGLFVHPVYTLLLVSFLRGYNISCLPYTMFLVFARLFVLASFVGVVAVSVDRFLAVHLHLRYQELVTHKRVVVLVISVWVSSAFVSALALLNLHDMQTSITNIVGGTGLVLSIMIYSSIFLTARRHKKEIRSSRIRHRTQCKDMANFASLMKLTVGVFYMFLLLLICYVPYFISLAIIKTNGPSILLKGVLQYSMTLLFLNSSLNPVIYCLKIRHIRRAIMDILRSTARNWNLLSRDR